MSGDHLAARMDAMHEAWDAMERHVLEKFETFALGYGLDLSLNDKKQWNDPTTNAASTAFFEGYCIGNVTLDNEGETEVILLEIAGRIRMTTDDPHNRKQFLDFELCDC